MSFLETFHFFESGFEKGHLKLVGSLKSHQCILGIFYFYGALEDFITPFWIDGTLLQLKRDGVSDGDKHSLLFLWVAGFK